MPTFEFLGLILALGLAWLWMDSLKAREAAIAAGRRACEVEGWQFLDDTVAIESLRPARNEDGRLTLRRTYGFEYSDTGNNRRRGQVTLIGREVVMLYTGPRVVSSHLTLH